MSELEPLEPVTRGEIHRRLERISAAVIRLDHALASAPNWEDIDRALSALRVELSGLNQVSGAEHEPIRARLAALESASLDHARAARAQRNATGTAVISAALSIVSAILIAALK